MILTVNQLLGLVHESLASTAPDGLRRNTVMKRLGQLSQELGAYGEYRVRIPKPSLSRSAIKTLESLNSAGLAKKEDCDCK